MVKFTPSDYTVLVVDDDLACLETAVATLKGNQYNVLVGVDSPPVIQYAGDHQPDIILLAVRMEGASGFEVCQQLKNDPQTGHIPVIFVTGLTNINSKLGGFAAGAVDYITEPYDPLELLARVQTHLSTCVDTADSQLPADRQLLEDAVQKAETELKLSRARFETLYKLSQMFDEPEKALKDFALEAAVKMTKSSIGYIYFMNEDETKLSLHAWSKDVMPQCSIVEPRTEYWVTDTGLWGEAARQRKPMITNDYDVPHPAKKGYPEGHVPLKRHMNVPLIDEGKIVLVAGVGNKIDPYDDEDIQHLTLIMGSMWRLVKQQRLTAELRVSERRYRQIFDTNQAIKLIIDSRNGRIVDANEAACQFYGYPYDVLTKMKIMDINLMSDEAVRAEMEQATHASRLYFNFQHRVASGEIRDVEVYSGPVETSEGILLYSIVHDITERKQAERALSASEQSYANLVNTIEGIVWELDVETFRFTFVSQWAEKLLGYPVSQWLEDPNFWRDHIHQADREWAVAYCADATRRHLDHEFEYRMIASNGRTVWLRDMVNVIVENGVAVRLQGVMIDITKHRETQESIRQLSQAVEQSPSSIVITDLNGTIQYVNPRFTQTTGYTYEEAIGQNPRILKSGHTTQEEYAELWRRITSGQEWRGEFKNVKKNGELYWESASISAITNKAGDITHFLGVKLNITDKKEMEAQIQQRNRELMFLNRMTQMINATLDLEQILLVLLRETQRLFTVSGCIIWLLDKENKELVCAQRTCDLRIPYDAGLVGWVAQHGKSLLVVDAYDDPDYVPLAGESGRSFLIVPLRSQTEMLGVFQLIDEQQNRFSEHDQRLMESLTTVVANAIENARLHESVKQQYQHLKQTQTRLVQSEKLAAIGELIAGVAHELNNPLASTILYSQLLQIKTKDPEISHDLDQIVIQARRASGVVRGLLDFARQHPPERVPIVLNDILKSTVDLLAYELRTHNVDVLLQLSPDVPLTMVDPHQMQQVFVNLINNAMQAIDETDGSGQLSLTTEIGRPQFFDDDQTKDLVIRVIVHDNGPGVSPEMQARIFDPFFTTKAPGKGTGLGLSVCHGIISEHEGHIWMTSEPGQGTTFYVELPVVEMPAINKTIDKNGADTLQDQDVVPSVRLLVIDDEESVLKVVTRILRRKGFQVDTASNGYEGLQQLRQTAYDLILCDLRMPVMGGKEFYMRASELYPDIVERMIFTTGDTLNPQTRQFLDEINAVCLSKPFELSDLLDMVRKRTLASSTGRV